MQKKRKCIRSGLIIKQHEKRNGKEQMQSVSLSVIHPKKKNSQKSTNMYITSVVFPGCPGALPSPTYAGRSLHGICPGPPHASSLGISSPSVCNPRRYLSHFLLSHREGRSGMSVRPLAAPCRPHLHQSREPSCAPPDIRPMPSPLPARTGKRPGCSICRTIS